MDIEDCGPERINEVWTLDNKLNGTEETSRSCLPTLANPLVFTDSKSVKSPLPISNTGMQNEIPVGFKSNSMFGK